MFGHDWPVIGKIKFIADNDNEEKEGYYVELGLP